MELCQMAVDIRQSLFSLVGTVWALRVPNATLTYRCPVKIGRFWGDLMIGLTD